MKCNSEDIHRVDSLLVNPCLPFWFWMLWLLLIVSLPLSLQWLSRPPGGEGVSAGVHAEEAAGWPAKGALTFMNVSSVL